MFIQKGPTLRSDGSNSNLHNFLFLRWHCSPMRTFASLTHFSKSVRFFDLSFQFLILYELISVYSSTISSQSTYFQKIFLRCTRVISIMIRVRARQPTNLGTIPGSGNTFSRSVETYTVSNRTPCSVRTGTILSRVTRPACENNTI